MSTKKKEFRKITRMLIAFICCFPIFVIIALLLDGAQDWLIFLIDMVVGGTILFVTYVVGDKKDQQREYLHKKHLEEIETRNKILKASKSDKVVIIEEEKTEDK